MEWSGITEQSEAMTLIIGDANLLLGHSGQEITKRVYRRIGATTKPSK